MVLPKIKLEPESSRFDSAEQEQMTTWAAPEPVTTTAQPQPDPELTWQRSPEAEY